MVVSAGRRQELTVFWPWSFSDARLAGFRALLACGMSHGLGGDAPEWPADVPVRVIAGTRANCHQRGAT